jgi:cytochrome c-type biogenesis protein CcmF
LPWLVATAFIHSAVVQRRRGMLQAWNLILIIATFSLTIFGTFLTRSGTVFSVHSFTQSLIGPVLLGFLGVILVGSLVLFAWRAPLMGSAPRMESVVSREGMFMINNLLLTLFAITVLVGTMYPLALEAFSGRQVSVGRPFFDRASVPIAFALLLAMGVGPVTPWRVARPAVVWERIRTPLIVALFTGAAAVLVGIWSVGVVIVIVLAAFVIGVIVRLFVVTVRARHQAGKSVPAAAASLFTREPGFWGGQVAHIGVALAAVAIAASSALAVRTEVRLPVGSTAVVEGYCLEYESPVSIQEANRRVDGVNILLMRSDCSTVVDRLRPSLNFFANSSQAVATPSVHTGIVEDVYVNIAAGDSDVVVLDVSVFPLMWLLWTGGLIIVAGGVWSFAATRGNRSRSGGDTHRGERELAASATTSEEDDD